ncbi:hypothetical protein ACPUEN_18970 [Algoriphagus yeomjeoni]
MELTIGLRINEAALDSYRWLFFRLLYSLTKTGVNAKKPAG